MPALLFGSIGTIADTSELQREAFNRAFTEHGLDWNWDQATYRELLTSSGGASRIAELAEQRGEQVDAAAVHETKSRIFREMLREQHVQARAGVADTIREAHANGFKVGFVTTTDADNVSALLDSLEDLTPGDFDLILDTSLVTDRKPDPAAYDLALEQLAVAAGDVVAIEDNVGGVAAARAASVRVVAFPGVNNAAHDFSTAERVIDRADFAELSALANAA